MESKTGTILVYARLSKKSGHTERSPDVLSEYLGCARYKLRELKDSSGRSRSAKLGAESPSTSFAQNAHCAQGLTDLLLFVQPRETG